MLQSRARSRIGGVLALLLLAISLLPACHGPAESTAPAPRGSGDESLDPRSTVRRPPEPSFPVGSFVIRSNPIGANVYVDGRLIGKTPVAYEDDGASWHLVYLTLEGYGPYLASGDFAGDGMMVDLMYVGSTTKDRESLSTRSLLPQVEPLDNPTGNRVWRVKGMAPFAAAISPDGRYMVGSAIGIEGGARRRDIIAVDLQSGEARQLNSYVHDTRLTMGALETPVGWTGGSEVVLLTQREPEDDPDNPALAALQIDLETGRQVPLGDFGYWAEGPSYVHASWLTSDRTTAFVHVSGHIWGLDLATKKRVIDLPVPTWDGLFRVSPSPDGWSVAHAGLDQQRGRALVYWLNLRSGEDVPVSSPGLYAQGAWWSPDGKRLAFGVSPRHADGYPVLPGEDSELLLPDAIEVVDLTSLTRQHIDLPVTPATFLWGGGDFSDLVGTRVDVTGDRHQPQGWQLQKRGFFRLNLATGQVTAETPLAPPEGTFVQNVRPDGDVGYLVTLSRRDGAPPGSQEWQGDRPARLDPDGRMQVLPGYAMTVNTQTVTGPDWPVVRVDDGLGWVDGRRLLTGPAANEDFFVHLVSNGWVVLGDLAQADDSLFVVAQPPARQLAAPRALGS